ncbi:hypothetical protein ABEB36_012767 [Hypothenemus hampei]|uniref:Uncharacterized protein n=1 Tax=Hypothenemus hampei TaxID=57062 RepID=A0ABD1ECC1_HYPHA
MYVDIVPKYDGIESSLSSFISSCDFLFDNFSNSNDDILKAYLLRVVQTRLVDKAQLLIGCRTELNTWELIKDSLTNTFGDNRSIECIEQDLFIAKSNKNEHPLDFGRRLQVLRSQLAQKLSSDVALPREHKLIHFTHYENLCLKNFHLRTNRSNSEHYKITPT